MLRDVVERHQVANVTALRFLVRTVWMEASSERQRMVNPRKAYTIDTALIALYGRTGRANLGHALETLVLLELERRRSATTWVRTPAGYEIDFHARHADGRHELIQVCADASDPETAKRELRALADAASVFPKASCTLITLHQSGFPKLPLPAKTRVVTAWQWLLG